MDDPPQAVGLAAEYLATAHGADLDRVQSCFDRIIEEVYDGGLPRGISLLNGFRSGPLTWPRRVLECKSLRDPLGFLHDEDLSKLASRMAIAEGLTHPRTPLYDLRRLGQLLVEFAAFQQSVGAGLLRDGLSTRAFALSPWLDVWLNKLYPFKIPFDHGVSSDRSVRPAGYSRFHERKRLTLPLTLQHEVDEERPPHKLLESQTTEPLPAIPFTWGRWERDKFVECDYADADAVARLHEDDMEWLGSIRSSVHEIKIRTLLLLGDALTSRDSTHLIERVVTVVGEQLDYDQVQKLLRFDLRYLGHNVFKGPLADEPTPIVPGGLSNILEVAGIVLKELEIGTLSGTRAALGKLVRADPLGRPRLVTPGAVDPYFILAGRRNEELFRSAVDGYASLACRETAFWAKFRVRLAEILRAQVPEIVAIPVKPMYRERLEPLISGQVLRLTEEIDCGYLSASALLPSPRRHPPVRFPAADGLRWTEVTIEFITDELVRISARGTRKEFTFADLGFADRRRGESPDMQWDLLKLLAKHNGELRWASGAAAPPAPNAKTKIKEIRKRLKNVIGIDEDPFEDYLKLKAYKTKFRILPSRADR